MNQHFFRVFKRFLVFLPVHVEDEAQHSGWILPGWEKHDLVAGESNAMKICVSDLTASPSGLNLDMRLNILPILMILILTLSSIIRWVRRCLPVTLAVDISSAWQGQELQQELELLHMSGM